MKREEKAFFKRLEEEKTYTNWRMNMADYYYKEGELYFRNKRATPLQTKVLKILTWIVVGFIFMMGIIAGLVLKKWL